LLRRDGRWQEQSREAYDRGNGAVILLYNRIQQTVVLIRQFRFPVWINGHNGFLIEAAAGLLDNASPEERIIAEAEEETGFRVTGIEPVFTAYMSPGSVTEKLYFFIAEYSADDRRSEGGGLAAEGRISKYWSGRWPGRYKRFAKGKLWMPKPLCYCNTWRSRCRRALPRMTQGAITLSAVCGRWRCTRLGRGGRSQPKSVPRG
jgi:hypothetical protein